VTGGTTSFTPTFTHSCSPSWYHQRPWISGPLEELVASFITTCLSGESCGVRQADFRSACSQPGRPGGGWRRQLVKSGPVELPQVEGA